jgi:hypothetical protein
MGISGSQLSDIKVLLHYKQTISCEGNSLLSMEKGCFNIIVA